MVEGTDQEHIWDKVASKWKEYRQKPLKEVEEFLKGKSGKILDLTCGSGRNFFAFSKESEIYGVDFSAEMLKLAEENSRKVTNKVALFKADAQELPFEFMFFDSAVYIAGLHCVQTPHNRMRSLKELNKVLKSGAHALITVWSKNQKRLKNKPKDALIPWTINGKKYERYYYIYDKSELEKDLRKAGFRIISSKEEDNIIIEAEKIKA